MQGDLNLHGVLRALPWVGVEWPNPHCYGDSVAAGTGSRRVSLERLGTDWARPHAADSRGASTLSVLRLRLPEARIAPLAAAGRTRMF